MENSIFSDYAIIRAEISDKSGNLIFRKSAWNFNPLAAMSSRNIIVEVSKIVEIGELDPS